MDSQQQGVGKWLKSVVIPTTISTIETGAFSDYSGHVLYFPEGQVEYGTALPAIGSYTWGYQVVGIRELALKHGYFDDVVTIPDFVVFHGAGFWPDDPWYADYSSPEGEEYWENTLTSYSYIPDTLYKAVKICNGVFRSQMQSLTIPKTIKNIEDNAFAYINKPENLISVISYIENPFDIDDNVFDKKSYASATLTVPNGCAEKYHNAEGWKNFFHIVEFQDSETTHIRNVCQFTEQRKTIYNLSGQRVNAPHKGIYIVGGKKVIVK